MSKRALMIYSHKYLLKIGIMTLTGLFGQAALAACPDTAGISIESNVVGTSNGKIIYFCKQAFDAASLTFKPSATELLPGGSQVISRGNTIQNAPFLSSADLSGFNINNLAFNTLLANFPNKNGFVYPSPSLFNFYTKTTDNDECDGSSRNFPNNQYQLMINYLKANSNVFQISSPSESVVPQSGTDIIKFNKVKLKSAIDPSKELTADIIFYRANNIATGQYFSNKGNGIQTRYCWLGVGTRVVINPNSGSLKYSGEHKINIGVLTNP